ncbi:MAG: DUF2339 domain-containing protein [Acetobacteraceae bacterium]|nr:DUF2339 domain-containing protein [Acetobacteraceae bacterium]
MVRRLARLWHHVDDGRDRLRPRAILLAALAVVGLTAIKVFLIDTSGFAGLWHPLSVLGLDLTLIGLGAAFRRFVGREEA